MNAHTNLQIIENNGVPTFAVLPLAEYEQLTRTSNGKRNTLPHEVVKMNIEQGLSLLKSWRIYLGLSQAELSDKVSSTQSQIANYENNKSIPRADTLLKISKVLGVNADLLMDF